MKNLLQAVLRFVAKVQQRLHTSAECTYLAATFLGAHEVHAYAAGVLLFLLVIGMILHSGE